jgi:hypothetical protein
MGHAEKKKCNYLKKLMARHVQLTGRISEQISKRKHLQMKNALSNCTALLITVKMLSITDNSEKSVNY